MNGQAKYPKGQGRPMNVKRAMAQQKRWKNNPKHKGMTDSFSVDVSLLMKTLNENSEATGIEFCNGQNGDEYAPVMAAINEDGAPLAAFNSTEEISLEEFALCRGQWKDRFKDNKEVLQFFFIGTDALMRNIEDFDITRYEASFVEKTDGKDSGLLFGYSSGVEKDPGGGDPDTALNFVKTCPMECPEGE